MTKQLFPAEFIFPGHPDKLSDAIADALVLEAWRRQPRALVGVEVAVHRDHVYVTGRIGCTDAQSINVTAIVREVYRSAGYHEGWYPSPAAVQVVSIFAWGRLRTGKQSSGTCQMTRPSASATRTTSPPQTICRLSNGWSAGSPSASMR